ncbi:MAG: GH3 auxin-responsive promoter family protein, partial [Moorea sp. SIO2I5]|nr:GH3 auxin-responsive promoter family protein [Moorena sp. SIO2I5]
ARGESNILTPDPVIYLNMTSGTTGKKKLIPVTKRSRQILNQANQIAMGFAAEASRKMGSPIGKILLTSSVKIYGRTSNGIEYGPVSAGDLRLNDFLYRHIFAHPYEALQPEDSLARHYICLLFALRNSQLRVIGANFPILALQLCKYLECHAQDLIKDLETGNIVNWLKLEPELRTKLERQFSAAPKRAVQLRSILYREGRLTPKLAWQNLSLIITARGGTSDFYFQRFPRYFGYTPIFGGIYASAEATFGIYHDLNTDSTILAIKSGFFEFIPQEEWNEKQPKILLPDQVKVGEYYRILVTNYSGLYRYDIGDVVEVVGFYEQTPLIVFRHRLGGLLSSTTEKTNEFHVAQVMQQLQQEFDLPLENFCITLSEHEIPPHYLVNIELSPGHTLSDPQAFLAHFDRTLKEIHASYEIKRRHQIPSPRLRILATGSFATVRQRLIQRGMPESQLKFTHISENRQFLHGLIVEQEISLLEDYN